MKLSVELGTLRMGLEVDEIGYYGRVLDRVLSYIYKPDKQKVLTYNVKEKCDSYHLLHI